MTSKEELKPKLVEALYWLGNISAFGFAVALTSFLIGIALIFYFQDFLDTPK